ncbi:MAG: family 10 glycosylhydrolase [bacterium]|nr:family 10 glycosylhydrolase [bacterium]
MKKGFIILLLLLFTRGVGTELPIETRGVWIDKSDVYKGKESVIAMFDKPAANFNTVYLPVLHRGYVIYPNSKYLPQDAKASEVDKDILPWMIEAAHQRGLLAESWPEFGFYAYHTKDASKDTSRGVILDKYPELTAIDVNGQPYLHNQDWGDFYSFCPSNPKSHRIMINLLCEPITRYQFDGLNLDRIRYPTKEFCFCAYCKKYFQKETGFALTKANLDNQHDRKAFYTWRKERLNKFMKKLSAKVRKLRPEMLITADVWIPEEINAKGQDWSHWLKKGYIDIAIPMMYWENIEPGLNDSLKISSDSRRILAGISAETNSSEQLVNQIELARQKNCGGVVIWYLGKLDDDLEYLRTAVFQTQSKPFRP